MNEVQLVQGKLLVVRSLEELFQGLHHGVELQNYLDFGNVLDEHRAILSAAR